jgi:hypothetical protein
MNRPYRGQLPGLFSLVAMALLMAALLTACVAKAPTSQTNHSLPSPTATSSRPTNTPGDNGGAGTTSAHHVGDTITVQGVSCTLVSATTIQGDANASPDAGNIFVLVHVNIVNGSSAQFTAAYLDFSTSSNGDSHSPEVLPPASYTANDMLAFTNLNPGASVEGDILFQVAQGDHNAMLVWEPSAFGNGTYTWNLGL